MSEETTSEQLAEIEGQATEYTPPEGWRVVRFGEQLLPGDVWVSEDGTEQRSNILQWDAAAVSGGRCIRRIEPEPQPEPEPVQVREGRWRTRGGHYVCVEAMSGDDFASIAYGYTWRGCNTPELQWNDNGLREIDSGERGPMDLVEYLGPIEQPEPQPSPQPVPEPDAELQAQVAFLKGREVTLGTRLQQERDVTTRLREELESVQKLLGTERQRVAQLEELVSSLRTINEGQEKAFEAANKENTALRNQLAAVKAELANVAADRYRLQVELDAAQQVPADSPELRQLRAELAEVTQDRDTYRHAHELLLNDVNATHQRTKAMTVEAIVEWLEPVRATIEAADNVQQTMRADNLACDIIRNLPGILRYVVGLNHPEEIE